MKLKKILSFTTSLILSASMLVGCGNKSNNESNDFSTGNKVYNIGMVTDTGWVNDESFNQSTWKGLQKIKKDYENKVDVRYLESKQDADYIPNIETFVDEDMDLIIGVGYKLKPSIQEAYKNYPDKNFVIIDEQIDANNVYSLLFEDNVSSYLTGLIAGKMTKTGKVGFIGGIESEVLDKFEYGFKAGVIDSNPNAKISTQYTNSFSDAALGKSIVNQMHSNNVDVIRSVMKNVDVAIYDISKKLVEWNYKGGQVIVNTLETGGVGIAPTTKNNVSQDILDYVNQMEEKIKSGDIKVPSNKSEFEKAYPNK